MSRFKRFTNSLLSGYVQLAVNSLFTLFTVKLALNYLSVGHYGLWAPTTVIASYITLMDFGFSGAAARILIDYKDHQKPEEYGGLIQTSVLVGFSQAGIIFLAGIGLAFILGPLLDIPAELRGEFFWLVMGQCVLTAAMFATRFVSIILSANQRFDITNYSSSFSLVVNFGVLWWSFAHHVGVLSLLWGQAAGVVSALAANWVGCQRLKLFPQRGQWGHPTWDKFRELFAFGRDIFLFSLGNQLVNFSQTLILTRLAGLDAAATWSVCTRAYAILLQVISRVFDFSTSALAEMMVRGERERLLRRFQQIEVLSINLALACGAILAVTNGPFVEVWTSGKVRWTPWNDLLIAVWLVIVVTVRAHTGLVGQSKAFRFMRYLFFIEGLAFVILTVLLRRFGGITLMLVVSIACTMCCTLPYGLWRTREYFSLSWNDLLRWHRSSLVLVATVAPVGALAWELTNNLPALYKLSTELMIVGIWTAFMFMRYGLGSSLRSDAYRNAPTWARPILVRIGFGTPDA